MTALYLPEISLGTMPDLLLHWKLSFPCKLMVPDALSKRTVWVTISGLDEGRRNTQGPENDFNLFFVRRNGGDFSILDACFPQSCSLAQGNHSCKVSLV